jgi:hypothetical protein
MSTVALQTNCWHRDWRRALTGRRLYDLVERCNYPFAERTLLINRLPRYDEALRLAGRLVDEGVLTGALVVEDHADAALRQLGTSRAELAGGYGYSIAEMVGLATTRCDYVLYFMSDCLPETLSDWIPKALTLLESSPQVRVANLLWDGKTAEARAEAEFETEDFFIGYGFSDQCYLVRTSDFRAPIYGHWHPSSARYPTYVHDGFERRVDSWMRNEGYLRATYRHASYQHRNLLPTFSQRLKRRVRRMLETVRG